MPAAALLATATLAFAGQPSFAPAPGWYALTTSAHPPSPPCAMVATVRIREPACEFPHRTVGALPRSGILVWALPFGGSPNLNYRPMRLPLRLAGTPLQHCFEGLDCRYGFQQILARVRGRALWVFVVYGRARPGPAQRATAAVEIARLTLR
jgi:hypothetical protein